MIYLCLLSIIGMGFSFSRYRSEDSKTDDAHIALYDVVIYSGDSVENQKHISVSVYATSKLSEPDSMIEGTYETKQINIMNKSECTVSLSEFKLEEIEKSDDNKTDIYKELVIPYEEMDNYKLIYGDNVPGMMIDYIGEYQADLSDMDVLDGILEAKNTDTFDAMDNCVLQPGETKTFYVIFWVEHDAVYKADADIEQDSISHRTLAELSVTQKKLLFSVHSEQYD